MQHTNSSPDCKIVEKRYFGLANRTRISRNPNPFEDPVDDSSLVHLCMCAREGCTNVETMSKHTTDKQPTVEEMMSGITPTPEIRYVLKSFPRCPICMTKYCSKECQIADHRHGPHKDKCAMFKQVKEHCEKTICKKCWPIKWNTLTDFYPQGIRSAKPYNPCKKCYMREMVLEDKLSPDITSDPDIKRVWLQ